MHTELQKLTKSELNSETDPELLRIAEDLYGITNVRLQLRENRYKITRALAILDQQDQKLDELLDLAIRQRLDRLEELRLESNHAN